MLSGRYEAAMLAIGCSPRCDWPLPRWWADCWARRWSGWVLDSAWTSASSTIVSARKAAQAIRAEHAADNNIARFYVRYLRAGAGRSGIFAIAQPAGPELIDGNVCR